MTRIVLALSLLFAACASDGATTSTAEQAVSVRWHYADGSIDADSGALSVDFKLSGLGKTLTTEVTARADAHALYACRNGGGNFPSDPKKQAADATVETTAEFPVDNGRVVGTLVLLPPLTSPALECPAGQAPVLVSVEYDHVVASNPDAGDRAVTGGPFELVLYEL